MIVRLETIRQNPRRQSKWNGEEDLWNEQMNFKPGVKV